MEHLPDGLGFLSTCVQGDQRDQLVRFWLAAPEDLLPSLWTSPVGEATKSMVRALTPQTSFTAEQVATRDAIGARLQAGFQNLWRFSFFWPTSSTLPSWIACNCQCRDAAPRMVDF